MNRGGIRGPLVALLVFGFAGSAITQGLHWEAKMRGGGGRILTERTEEMWAIPKMMKSVNKETGEMQIVRLDKEVFIHTIDLREKTYEEITFAEMESMMKKAVGKMETEMAEVLAGMPEEQRKKAEEMMADKMPGKSKDPKIEVKKTGDTKTISGFSCTKFVVTRDGKEAMTMWATKDVEGFESMRKDWEEFSRRLMVMNPTGKGLGDAFRQIDGFPIQTEVNNYMTSTVTMIETKAAPAREFEIPAGFKKVKLTLEDMEK